VESLPISAADKDQIYRGNAERLLGMPVLAKTA
jgi:hypothetical protein